MARNVLEHVGAPFLQRQETGRADRSEAVALKIKRDGVARSATNSGLILACNNTAFSPRVGGTLPPPHNRFEQFAAGGVISHLTARNNAAVVFMSGNIPSGVEVSWGPSNLHLTGTAWPATAGETHIFAAPPGGSPVALANLTDAGPWAAAAGPAAGAA